MYYWIYVYQSVNAILSDVIAMYGTDGHLDKCLKSLKFISVLMSTLNEPMFLCYFSEMGLIVWVVLGFLKSFRLINCGLLKILHCCTCFQNGVFANVFLFWL